MKRNTWVLFTRASSVVSLISGSIFIGQLVFVVITRYESGVPTWFLLSACVSAFVFGIFGSMWIGRQKSTADHEPRLRTIGRIAFDYLPQPPTKHGWHLGFDRATSPVETRAPSFTAAERAPVAGSIKIEDNGRYYIEYAVEQIQSLANVVEYCVKPTRDGTVYMKVELTSRDRTQSRTVWLRHVIGTGAPRPINPSEWSFDVQGELFDDGWTLVKLQLDDEVCQSFGKAGYIFQSICGIRIRGSLCISPITFYRID